MSAQPQDLLCFEPMTEKDLAGVVAIETRTYPYPWTLGNFRDSLQAGHACWMCRYGSNTVGYTVVMLAGGEAHLLNLTIAPQWQGLGHGGRLLTHVIEQAKRERMSALLLEVRLSNQAAQNLYVGFGFRAIGVRRGYYPAPVGREDAIVMELRWA